MVAAFPCARGSTDQKTQPKRVVPHANCFAQRWISTIATLFTPLSARYSLPSLVATMLRTTPPPEGIVHFWNCCDCGSNITNVFGFTPDSLYQTFPSCVMAIP